MTRSPNSKIIPVFSATGIKMLGESNVPSFLRIRTRASAEVKHLSRLPFRHPNTDTNIPTFINLPPTGPNIFSATIDAGEAY